GPTVSRPNAEVSPIRSVATAPSRVVAFQKTKSEAKVAVNAVRESAGVRWAMEAAAVSSMTPCAATARRAPRQPRRSAMRSPYRVLRAPSSSAPTAPAIRLPPPATTPTSANCEAPVKANRLSAHAWGTLSPAATAAVPNAVPETPTARPMPSASRTGGERGKTELLTLPNLGRRKRPVLERYCASAPPDRRAAAVPPCPACLSRRRALRRADLREPLRRCRRSASRPGGTGGLQGPERPGAEAGGSVRGGRSGPIPVDPGPEAPPRPAARGGPRRAAVTDRRGRGARPGQRPPGER